MWGWVWTLLVLGALVVLGLIAWTVVRAGFRVLRQAGRSSDVLSQAGARTSQAVAEAEADRTPARATLFDDPAALREHLHGVRTRRWARRDERRVRQAVLWRRWSATTWLERRRAGEHP